MLYPLLLTAVIVGPPTAPAAEVWQDEYRVLMFETRAQAHPELADVVPRLVSLYTRLADAELHPRAERTRMQKSLAGRLVRQLEQLLIEKRKHELAQQRVAARGGTQTLAGGGATAFAAQQLIDVIVTTIAPDSWQRNGGKGSISFYATNPALVIRQSSEVHGEIQNLLRDLR